MAAEPTSNYAWVWVLIVVIGGAAVWMYVGRDDGTADPADTEKSVETKPAPAPPKPLTLTKRKPAEDLGRSIDQILQDVAPVPQPRSRPEPPVVEAPPPPAPKPVAPVTAPKASDPYALKDIAPPAPVVPVEPEPRPVEPAPTIVIDPAPAVVSNPTPAPTERSYTIQEGDTFSLIAQDFYGEEKHWVAIAQANPLVDPKRLKVGQVIKLPDLAEFDRQRDAQLAGVQRAVSGGASKTVTVQAGDVLSRISRRVYGSSAYWPTIYAANRGKLASPDDLQVGMVLVIPPKPARVPEADGAANEQTIK